MRNNNTSIEGVREQIPAFLFLPRGQGLFPAVLIHHLKMTNQLGIEMAEVIPGFATRFDIADLVACFAPRNILIVSATQDMHAQDAERLLTSARETCSAMGIEERIEHHRYEGGHSLTQERFDDIVSWLVSSAG
jgi:hypothetical protein